MNQKINDIVLLLKKSFQTAEVEVIELKNGIRLKFQAGYYADIFKLTNRLNHICARLTLNEADPVRRQAYVESTQNLLVIALDGIASVASFKISMEVGGDYIYNSELIMDSVISDDSPIEIADDAIEVIEDDMVDELEAVNAIETGDDSMETDDLAEFELDFGFEEENRLKIVKTRAEEAIENLEIIDAKTLRQSLDMMNLKRSSVIRLALTRIFRSVSDVEELEAAIQDESQKIVSPQDRAELQEVKSLCANGFLDPVVDLLWQEVFEDLH